MQYSSDEVFLNLIRVANEDEKIRKFMLALSDLDDFGRQSLINSFVTEMAFKGAPSQLMDAVGALRDGKIAKAIGDFLKLN